MDVQNDTDSPMQSHPTRRVSSPLPHHHYLSEDDDDEPECRVCRGPAEEGRPLYRPCKCSGSIAMTHQDCLQSWLEVKGGNDKCDLCHTKFQFVPEYAPDAPERLSRMEVFLGLMLRAASKWIPFGIRILLVAGVWLGLLPLMTAYLYQGWMHRPSSIKTRFRWNLVPRDIVNGGILTVIIVISFLSIMSLLDFFRVKWVREMARNQEGGNRGEKEKEELVSIAPMQIEEDEDNLQYFGTGQSLKEIYDIETYIVDNTIKKYKRDRAFHDECRLGDSSGGSHCSNTTSDEDSAQNDDRLRAYEDGHEDSEDDTSDEDDEDSLVQRMMRLQEMGERDHGENEQDEINNDFFRNIQFDPQRLNPELEAINRQLDEDNAMDADIQMPIQQLIGLRGPIGDVFRNLAWLLAFQTTFIGLFLCMPRYVGSVAFRQLIVRSETLSNVARVLIKYVIFVGFDIRSKDGSPMDLNTVAQIMNEANEKENSLFQPKDIGHILFGYIFMSVVTFLSRGSLSIYRRFDSVNSRMDDAEENIDLARDAFAHHDIDGMRMGNHRGRNFGRDHRNRMENQDVGPEEMKAFIADFFGTVIEITAASSKISFLVCFKMFILPSLLGSWLDLSTLKLFDSHIEDRLIDAGGDIIGFFLLHWVVGITFMLTVTVSVLQLREVFHPDLLAPVIRPQEPQPDLLINLLEDSWWTHTKRMVPSLGIYAMILAFHVWLPCKLMYLANIHEYIPLFRPHFWYPLYSHLQRPLELMIFHLSVLSILEKNKNCLGELQHAFLSKLLKTFGLFESFLPRNIVAWEYVGERDLFSNEILSSGKPKVDRFWEELINLQKRGIHTDAFVESCLDRSNSSDSSKLSQNFGMQRKYILLSQGKNNDKTNWILMPAHLGSFCFRKKICSDGRIVIQIWKERVGDPIARPPKGWDYLADGGAAEQGRWAWGKKEKMSDIELRVAARTPVVPILHTHSTSKIRRSWYFLTVGIPRTLKLCIAAIISWIGVTAFTSGIIFLPFIVGRIMLRILEVPDSYVHDPFVLVFGSICIAPIIKYLFRCVCNRESEMAIQPKRKQHLPPLRKIYVLVQVLSMWFLFCPLLVGCLYQQLFGTSTLHCFKEVSFGEVLKCLPVGILLTHIWAAACYIGAFKYEFWITIRQIAIDGIAGAAPPDRNNNRRQAQEQVRGVNNPNLEDDDNLMDAENLATVVVSSSWQGRNGNVGRFARTLFAVLVHQEWDKIDRVLLLDDFLIPLFRCLVVLLVAPVASFIAAETLLHFDFYDGVLSQSNIYRAFMFCSISLQIALKFQDTLDSWYEAAHKTARDHRYLIGEVLRNYESES